MRSKANRQSGFTLVETLLVVVVLLLVGFIGYYVYSQNHKSAPDDTAATSTKPTIAGSSDLAEPSAAKKITYNKLQADAKQAIFAAATSIQPLPDCYKGVTVDTFGNQEYKDTPLSYDPAGLMFAGISYCDSGAVHLFVKQSGVWKDVEQTQDTFSCSTFAKYSVPRQLLSIENAERVKESGISGTTPYDCVQADGAIVEYKG